MHLKENQNRYEKENNFQIWNMTGNNGHSEALFSENIYNSTLFKI